MDTNPLPNQDDDISDSGLLHYVVRVTSHGKFTYEQIHEFIQSEYQICRYVISRETVPQEHFHLVLSLDQALAIQDVRDIIRAFLVPFWQSDTGKLPKGFGNKQYNLQLSQDIDKAVSYAVKLGEYVYDGWEEEYILACKAESYEKKKPSNFKSEYMTLCLEFQESDMDIREFMVKFCVLKSRYGQQVRMSDAYSYGMSNLILRDPEVAVQEVEKYLYNI